MTFLETTRLLFRTHQPADEEEFIKMQTDPEVRRYVGGSAWPVEKAIDRFRNQYLGHPSQTFGLWATILKAENRYIGHCGLSRPAEDGKSANLAYYLARPYWGQGLALEASAAFIEIAFGPLGLEYLVASVQQGHGASEHILQKFGFVLHNVEGLNGRVFHHYRLAAVVT